MRVSGGINLEVEAPDIGNNFMKFEQMNNKSSFFRRCFRFPYRIVCKDPGKGEHAGAQEIILRMEGVAFKSHSRSRIEMVLHNPKFSGWPLPAIDRVK